MRRVVVTGMGLVTPAGVGKAAYFDALDAARSCVRPITRFDTTTCPVKVAGEASGFSTDAFIPLRVAKRGDRFSHLALAAAQLGIEDAVLDLDKCDRHRVGIVLGNNLGGWEIGERGLYDLMKTGAATVSPYQASAWFPAAPQGHISLKYGLQGFSKTVVADRASGLAALAMAVRSIRLGHADVILAGGMEAPLAPYAMHCYISAGDMSEARDAEVAFLPFDRRRGGLVIAEGATILVLEELEHARRRDAHILAELPAYAVTNDPAANVGDSPAPQHFLRTIQRALEQADWRPDDVDLVCADGSGLDAADRNESAALRMALGKSIDRIPVTVPKAIVGHMLGAAGPADVAAAIHFLHAGKAPKTAGYRDADPDCSLPITTSDMQIAKRRNALVTAHGRGGVSVCMGVRAHG